MHGTEELEKRTREFREASAFRVAVGTNGYQVGDAGHGSRTYLRIDGDGADVEITADRDGQGVTIELGGDSELSTFIQALDFAANSLREMARGDRAR